MSQIPRFSWAHGPEDVFIARMARERKRHGWTLERMADEVNEVSGGAVRMHQSAFTKMEREADRRNLRLDEAYFIAQALGMTIQRMLTDDDLEGIPARIHELQQQHRALVEELTATDRRHNEIVAAINEIGAEATSLREALNTPPVDDGLGAATPRTPARGRKQATATKTTKDQKAIKAVKRVPKVQTRG
jgi:transcriptional regulator with XRE-family HTH domain